MRKRKEKRKHRQRLTWGLLGPFKLVALALYITFVGRDRQPPSNMSGEHDEEVK